MAFNFLQGARPAAPLQLLPIRRPVIPSGLGTVTSYRHSFKHAACLPQQRQCVSIQYTISSGMTHGRITNTQETSCKGLAASIDHVRFKNRLKTFCTTAANYKPKVFDLKKKCKCNTLELDVTIQKSLFSLGV